MAVSYWITYRHAKKNKRGRGRPTRKFGELIEQHLLVNNISKYFVTDREQRCRTIRVDNSTLW